MTRVHEEYLQDLSDSEDVLSFANLPIAGYMYDDVSNRVSSSSEQDRFEFLNSFSSDPVRNYAFSLWGRTSNKSLNGLRTGSRKSGSSSIRVSVSDNFKSNQLSSVQKENVAGVGTDSVKKKVHVRCEPAQESQVNAVNGKEQEQHTWRESYFGNVLAKFGCLSA